jgi:hypothetical protein
MPAPSKGLQGGNLWEKNVFKEESLLCNQKEYDVVIVGSSISATLVHLPKNWFNLAMASYSSINGLEVICNSELKPCTILVETNNLNLGTTPYPRSSPIGRTVKRQLPAFQSVNKPAHVGLRILGKIAGLKSGASRPPSFAPHVSDKRTVPDKIFEQALHRRLETMSTYLKPEELSKKMDRLKNSIATLESRGFKIAFIEVPECQQTSKTVRKNQVSQAIKSSFPDSKYRWIDDHENCQMYASNDAIHLVVNSAYRFTQKLVQQFSQ